MKFISTRSIQETLSSSSKVKVPTLQEISRHFKSKRDVRRGTLFMNSLRDSLKEESKRFELDSREGVAYSNANIALMNIGMRMNSTFANAESVSNDINKVFNKLNRTLSRGK